MGEPTAVQPDGNAATVAEAKPSQEELQAGLEAEKALRTLAEEERDNAKKDIIALKTGKKRGEIDLANPPEVQTTGPDAKALADALAEANRVNAELARAMANRGVLPTGGGGVAESPAPKPRGYWSEEQKAFLKAKRGMSDAMIEKAEKLAQKGGATGTREAHEVGITKRPY